MGIKSLQADLAGAPLLLGQRLQGDHQGREPRASRSSSTRRRPAAATTTAASPSRFRGGGHKQRYRIIDWQARQDRRARARSRRSSTIRTARRASRSSTTPTARSATSSRPTASKVGDTIVSSRNADIKPGNACTLRYIPLGTTIHNIELKKGKGGQLVRSAGVAAQLMAKDGDVRAGPPAERRGPQGAPRLPRDDRPGLERRPREHLASARPVARAGSASARTTAASP